MPFAAAAVKRGTAVPVDTVQAGAGTAATDADGLRDQAATDGEQDNEGVAGPARTAGRGAAGRGAARG